MINLIWMDIILLLIVYSQLGVGFLWKRPFGKSVKSKFVAHMEYPRVRFDGGNYVPDGDHSFFPFAAKEDYLKEREQIEMKGDIDLDDLVHVEREEECIPFDEPVLEKMRKEKAYLPDEVAYMDDLKNIWKEYCEDNNIDESESSFSFEKVLPLVMGDNTILKIEERRPRKEVRVSPVYWSNQDLRNLWEAWKPDPPHLKSQEFSFYEAWALVPDQDPNDPDVVIITENELRRIWRAREKTTLGMPSDKFNIKDALKLVTPMRMEIDSSEYESTIEYRNRVALEGEPEQDFSHIEDPVLREKVRQYTKWIDRKDTILSPPQEMFLAGWRTESEICAPESMSQWIETSLPRGGDEDYPGQFPAIANTLGEPDKVFPDMTIPPWEVLDLPIGPKYRTPGEKTRDEVFLEEWEVEKARVKLIREERDRLAAMKVKRPNPFAVDTRNRKKPKTMFSDEESFFRYFNVKEDPDPDDFPGINGTRAKHFTVDQRFLWDRSQIKIGVAFPLHIRDVMDLQESEPERYAQRVKDNYPEEDDYISYETASLYNSSFYELSGNRHTDDDEYYLQTSEWFHNFTNLYLMDLAEANRWLDEIKVKERQARADLYGIPVEREPIPEYLMPDKDRGVNYTMELIEMFSKVTLQPVTYYDNPRELFGNETSDPDPDNTDFKTQGTIMIQYDWQPSDNRTFSIDPAMEELLEPLKEFAGTLIELRSTSEGVIIYDYFGPMRHIIGIRASLRYYAQQLDPTIKDVRVETTRVTDDFDHDMGS